MIAAVAAITTASAVAFSLSQTPIYESTAEVLVESPAHGDGSAADQAPNMETERELASSAAVAELVVEELDLDRDLSDLVEDVEVDVPAETEILTFTYSHREAAEAQRGAQAFADAYLAYRSEQTLEDARAVTKPLQQQIDLLSEQLQEVEALAEAEADPGQKEALGAEARTLAGRIAILQQQIAAVPLGEIRAGRVVEPAPLPDKPARPNHVINGIVGLALGLMLGVGTAIGRDYFDDHIRGRTDLEFYSGAHVLAVVPHERGSKKSRRSTLVTVEQPSSPAAEAFRQLRTNILFAASKRDARTILITSAQAGEGKTSTTANLGVALARAGKKVILVSADLRKPRLHAFFDLPNLVGVTNVLSREVAPLDALQRVGVEHLRVLATGSIPGNPAELLESDDMHQLLIELRRAAQFVLVDTAPLLPVADASTLVPYVDAVVFVADARRSTRTAVQHAAQRLNQVNAPVIGSVYNNVDLSKAAGYPAYAMNAEYAESDREGTG